jgi:Na+/serine symporter
VARQQALVVDIALATLLAVVALTVAAGIGVVAAGALLALLVALAWIGVEAALGRLRRAARRPRRRSPNA